MVSGLVTNVHHHINFLSKNNSDNNNVNGSIWFLDYDVSFDINVSPDIHVLEV